MRAVDEKRDATVRRTAFAFEQYSSRDFFFFFFCSCRSIIFDSFQRHHRLFRIFSLGFRSSRIGLPLNQVNRDDSLSPIDRGGKIRRRSIIYLQLCDLSRRVRFQGCIVQPPTRLSFATCSTMATHARLICLSITLLLYLFTYYDRSRCLLLSTFIGTRNKIESKSNPSCCKNLRKILRDKVTIETMGIIKGGNIV